MQNKRAYIWGLGSKIGPSAIQLVTNMILARFLSPSDFGTIGVLTIIFTVANVLVDSGLGGSLVKEKVISKEDCTTIATFNLGVSFFLYLCIFLSSPILEDYFSITNLSFIIRILALTFVIGSFGLVPKSILIRDLRFDTFCIITIIGIFISSSVSIIMAIYDCGVYSLVAFQLLNVIITSIGSIVVTRYSMSLGFYVTSFKRLFPFGFFTTLTSVVDTIYENLLTTLIGKYVNLSQAGYLSQAKKLEESMTTSVTLTIANVSFPILTKLKENQRQFQSEANSLMRTIIMLVFPLLFFVIIFSNFIITLIFGDEWLPAAFYLSALMWAGMILIIETLLKSFIKSLCDVKRLAYATFLKRFVGIVLIIATMLLNSHWAIYGYIASSFIGLIVNAHIYSNIIKKSMVLLLCDLVRFFFPSLIYFILAIVLRRIWENNSLEYIVVCTLFLLLYYIVTVFILWRKPIIGS